MNERVPSDPDLGPWIEWVAHNMALGVRSDKISSEMETAGINRAVALDIIETVNQSPIQRAAQHLARDLRKWEDLNDVLLGQESQCFDFDRIQKVKNLSSEDFLKDYYSLNRPVIIQDVVSRWPAVKKWTLKYLRETYGQHTVRFQNNRSMVDHRDAFVDHSEQTSLATYIDMVEIDGPSEQYYLIAHDRMLDRPEFSTLLNDISMDSRYFDASDVSSRVFFWLGPEGSLTPLHRDLGNVFFAQIMGRKRVKLVPSRQIHKVYNETGYHSEVDFEAPDYTRFPRLKETYIMDEVIEPGDLLFIPVGWWHHVRSLDVSITVTGNNFCFPNKFTEIF